MNIPRVTTEGFVPPARTKPETVKAAPSRSTADVFKPEQNEKLMSLLHAEPDARPDAVARARALVADPTYPTSDVLEKLAQVLIGPVQRSK